MAWARSAEMLTERNGQYYLVDRGEVRRKRRRVVVFLVLALAVGIGVWLWLRGDDGGAEGGERRAIPNAESSRRDGVAVSEAILEQRKASAAALEAANAAGAAQSTRYEVRSGDTLGIIAERHGCDLDALRRANRVRGDVIYEGQKIVIPGTCERVAMAAPARPRPAARRGPSWRQVGVDTRTLPKLMRSHGFSPPSRFKAFVIEITFDKTRQVIVRERAWDWHGSSDDLSGWNPASTVKLFAAIGALKRIETLDMTSSATVTFHSDDPYIITVTDLIRESIVDSDNIAYNRTVQLAGFDFLHEKVLRPYFGLHHTALMRAYAGSKWQRLGEERSLRHAPKITLDSGGKHIEIEAATGAASTGCGAAACTSLQDLGEGMRRLMLQEQLPDRKHFGLERRDLIMLRRAMRAERSRGNNVVDAFGEAFDHEGVKFYSKPGFASGWFSDNVYIFDPHRKQAWVVAMAGHPGRDALNDAARVLGTIIESGELKKAKHDP